MKKRKLISASLFFLLLLTLSTSLSAQDPIKAAANVYKKVLLDNAQVRVLQVEFAPGDVAAWHQHPNHVVYVLAGGKIEITNKGKEAMVMDLNEGDAMYMPAVTHMAKNVGTTPLKLVVTELKPPMKK